jgi:hypothetical protein
MAPSTVQKLKAAVTGQPNDESSLITEVTQVKYNFLYMYFVVYL